MKILHIITSLRIGGAEVALLNLLCALKDDTTIHHTVVCFYPGPIVHAIRELGIKVMVVQGIVKGYDPVGLATLFIIALRYRPTIIHTALWAANMAGRIIGALLRIPVINELHGNVIHEGYLRNTVDRLLLSRAHRIIAVSPSVRTIYEHHMLQALPLKKRQGIEQRLLTITNGIDRTALINRIQAQPLSRGELGLADDDFVVGSIGRFEKIKSYDLLIRSFARFKDLLPVAQRASIKLCLVGDGSERAALQTLARSLVLDDQVVFTGYRLDAYRFYSLFDCFALSSQSEGLSIALLEALALGVPVISTHQELEHDAIVPNINGLLIPVNDVERYAHGLLKLYQHSIKKSDDFSPLSPFSFSIDVVKNQYQQLYRKLASKIEA